MAALPKLTLVLGGAASGKSAFAEALCVASGQARTYIATARIWDDEMAAKVARHVAQRGDGWKTISAQTDLASAIAGLSPADVALVDCVTMWLTNLMMDGADLDAAREEFDSALAASPAPMILVSNDVGGGIVPDNALARRFQNEQGRLNQHLVARAKLVVMVTAGLPMVLKGVLPDA